MLRTALINIVIFFITLLVLNIISFCVLEIFSFKNGGKQEVLPNFKGYEEEHLGFEREMKNYKLIYNSFDGWRANQMKGKYLNIDKNGIRKTVEGNNSTKTTTWWFLGGSVMWGAHNIDNTTIPSLIALATDSIEVKNYAEQGFYSRQELVRLVNLYSNGGKPAMVISLDGINEVNQLCQKSVSKFGHTKSRQVEELVAKNTATGFLSIWYDCKSLFYKLFLTNTSKTMSKIHSKYFDSKSWSHLDDYICDVDQERAKYVAEQLIRNWEMMYAIVDQNGGQFIALLQPTVPMSKARTNHIQDKLVPKMEQQVVLVYEHIQELITEKNYDWIYDLTSVFDEYENDYIYTDICHVSYNGNEVISKQILEIIQ